MKDALPIVLKGHLKVTDDLGQVLVDKDNAIHPQNMARIIARALGHQDNSSIFRMAFGNGGTEVNAAYQISYNTANDGQPPDTNTWDSRLYNETFSKVVDATSSLFEYDIGSSDANTGTRPGGGADPSLDPVSVPFVSGPGVLTSELGLTSQVTINCVLAPGEPSGQTSTDQLPPTESTETSFMFDEIGLYTSGAPAIDSYGYQEVDVNNQTTSTATPLLPNTQYSFTVSVDGNTAEVIQLLTPASGSGSSGEILFGDLCNLINLVNSGNGINGATVTITDDTGGSFSTVPAYVQTYGFLKFQSNSSGATSSISLSDGGGIGSLFTALGGTIETAIDGQDAGIQNNPVTPTAERERLLTHVIFSPVLKSANRTLSINYTITVSVARSV